MSSTVLVIDDMIDVRLSANFLLSNHHYHVLEAESPLQAFEILEHQQVDLIILDMNYTMDTTSGNEGLTFLDKLFKTEANIPVVAMTGWSSVDLAVKAMQQGASDFIEKPWDNQRFLQIVKQQLAVNNLKKQNSVLRHQNNEQSPTLIWRSPSMIKLAEEIEQIAKTDATVLLTGENGTGKSSIAMLIHQQSQRSDNALVTVNMGAIPESLFESEMFGHKKGAFTDAKENRIGRFEMADKASLFLDEIANIPLAQQAKLLRVLESNEYEMVGSSITQKSDVRLISASNANFDQLIASDKFRADLFYRLNTIELHIPPLRERLDDLMPLAQFFVKKHSVRYGGKKLTFAADVEYKLKSYAWPGNIRELSHMIERAVLLAKGDEIHADDIVIKGSSTTVSVGETGASIAFMTLDQAEQQLLQQALNKTSGSAIEAAELLGISKSAIYRRMEKYGIKS
jgi:DNA-binding NtrC family response regulator